MAIERKQVGEILIEQGIIDENELEQALLRQQAEGGRLGKILVKMGYASEDDIASALSEQMELEHINLSPNDIDSSVVNIIPEDIARKYDLIPIKREGSQLIVAMDDPLNSIALDLLTFAVGMRVVPVLASRTKIRRAIESFYLKKRVTSDSVLGYDDERLVFHEETELSEQKLRYESKLALTVKSVNMILVEGVRRRASDVHIELDGALCRVRYRIDGILHESFVFPAEQHLGIVARIKVLSNLDLTERRLPQDGSFRMQYENQNIDLRVSTLPMVQGENVMIRILVQDADRFDIRSLGLSQENLNLLLDSIKKSSGLIISTGPTGSGKSTTLYALLHEISSMERKIITVEDPVEYRFPIVNQISIKPTIGLDFATSLRAILRHDPDVILVGEIRDSETADICIRAGLTGHLVLSTLHTREAAECPIRLIDMGIEPYLVADTIDLIIAQRLVRKLCPKCKREIEAKIGGRKIKAFEPVGCIECTNGFLGRIGVYEIIPGEIITSELIKGELHTEHIREKAREAGIRTLWEEGIILADKGITSLGELKRSLPIDFAKYVISYDSESNYK